MRGLSYATVLEHLFMRLRSGRSQMPCPALSCPAKRIYPRSLWMRTTSRAKVDLPHRPPTTGADSRAAESGGVRRSTHVRPTADHFLSQNKRARGIGKYVDQTALNRSARRASNDVPSSVVAAPTLPAGLAGSRAAAAGSLLPRSVYHIQRAVFRSRAPGPAAPDSRRTYLCGTDARRERRPRRYASGSGGAP